MTEKEFKYANDLLKHHIRVEGWLPNGIKRQKKVTQKIARRLRYLTFCAPSAIDVLLLNDNGIVNRSKTKGFDNVVFFDYDLDNVQLTNLKIPRAIGFPKNFIEVVLFEDPDGRRLMDFVDPEISKSADFLTPPKTKEDTAKNRKEMTLPYLNLQFQGQFPFDIINLDLETYFFKPKEALPGQFIKAFRKVLEWQKTPFILPGNNKEYKIDEFSLWLTTRIGPPELPNNYLDMLSKGIENNIESNNLVELFKNRTGAKDVKTLLKDDFEDFFRIAIPKNIQREIIDKDWYIDEKTGINIYEIERNPNSNPYKILHLILNVKRQNPSEDDRATFDTSYIDKESYKSVARQIFKERPILVNESSINKKKLRKDLKQYIS